MVFSAAFPRTYFLRVLACVLAALLTSSPIAYAQASADSLYKAAGEAYDRGDLEQAISLYEKLVALRPESVEARTNFGVALAHVGRYDDAIAQYLEALKHDHQNPLVRLNLALAWYKQADFVKAADELSELRKDHPEGQQSLYLLADCYLRLGKNGETVTLLQPAYNANPDDRVIDYALGTALIREGRLNEGERIIDRILKGGDNADVNLLMGAAQLAGGDPQKAVFTIRQALDKEPNLPGGWSLYGQALQDGGDSENAKDAFRHAVQADPNDFDANLRLGAVLRHDGNPAEAGPYLEHALRLRPSSIPARYQVGSLNAALGKFELARKDLEQVEHDSPDFQEVHVQLAALYARMGLTSESQREREIVLKLNEKARAKGPQASQ
jgi:tetratricopeptide (TPR) repeat protein